MEQVKEKTPEKETKSEETKTSEKPPTGLFGGTATPKSGFGLFGKKDDKPG